MSLLELLKAKKADLKITATNITHIDGSQQRVLLSKGGVETEESEKLKPKAYGFIVDTKPDIVPGCILENFLYLGSQDAVTQENVEKYNLTDILSIGIKTPELNIQHHNGSNSINFHFIECLDLPETQLYSIIQQTNQIIRTISNKKGRVLVHCNAGVSRSSTICIAYLIMEHNMCFDSAISFVKSKRECIRPNDGFLKQLQQIDHKKC